MQKHTLQVIKVKVKRSRYRPSVAQREGRFIPLPFYDRGIRRGLVVSSTSRPNFTPRKDPVPIVQEAGWVSGPVWTGGKSRPHQDSILDHPVRTSVAMPTVLPGPQIASNIRKYYMYVCMYLDTPWVRLLLTDVLRHICKLDRSLCLRLWSPNSGAMNYNKCLLPSIFYCFTLTNISSNIMIIALFSDFFTYGFIFS